MLAEAPWWGIPVVAGVFALLGAILTQLSTYLIERSRRQRERSDRWDQDLRDCAARFLVLVNDEEERWEQLDAGEHHEDHLNTTREAFVALQFVANDAIARAAHELMDLVYGKVFGSYAMEGDGGLRINRDITSARNTFVGAVRDRLGGDALTIDAY